MRIWCTGCHTRVEARLTDGREMYPHRHDLASMPFWVCDKCGAFVGTHHKTKRPTEPLGVLATPEIKKWRKMIHGVLDPLWRARLIDRRAAYAEISAEFGRTYHTGEIYSVEEAKKAYAVVQRIRARVKPGPWDR